jgi:hypothetical protein
VEEYERPRRRSFAGVGYTVLGVLRLLVWMGCGWQALEFLSVNKPAVVVGSAMVLYYALARSADFFLRILQELCCPPRR